MGCSGRQGVYCPGFHQYLLCSWWCVDTETVALALRRACIGSIIIKRRRDRTPKVRSKNFDSANRRAATGRWRKSRKPLCYPLPQLYGSRWRRPTARTLRVDSKTVSRWMAGQSRPTINDVLVLLEMVRQQIDDLTKAHRATLNALPGRPYDPDVDCTRTVLPTRNASKGSGSGSAKPW